MKEKPEISAPLFRKIDCIELAVANLEDALAFYRDRLGHTVVWRSETTAGLRLAESDAELLLQTERPGLNADLLVESADDAARVFVQAGGELVAGPFDSQIGRCAVVRDPWGNPLVLLDMSKGRLITDDEGHIIGNEETR